MKQPRARRYLEVITSVAVVLTALAMLWIFISGSVLKPSNSKPLDGLHTGESLPQLPNYSYGDTDKTLIIALSTKCRYCTEEVTFFNELAGTRNNNSTRILAVFPESSDEVEQYVRAKNLTINFIAGIKLEQLNLASVPAEILVDRKGKILNFWIGGLAEGVKREITEAIE